ncbi:MAG: 2OG-Fe dioxygenase family protein [Planctomycetota bacterium]
MLTHAQPFEKVRVDEGVFGRAIELGFDDLARDRYATATDRRRRFSQYRGKFEGDRWRIERLPHRPFVQPLKYNSLIGGVLRDFEPIAEDVAFLLEWTARHLELERDHDWQANLHMIRTRCSESAEGIVVPEGRHQDGHQYVTLMCVRRTNITGGRTYLYDASSGRQLTSLMLEAGECLLIDDRLVAHDTTPIQTSSIGSRDMIVMVWNEWEVKHYGEDYERAVVAREPGS